MSAPLSALWVTREHFDFGPTEKPLGCGNFGRVVEATDTRTGRKVAVKFITQPINDPSQQKHFIQELTILAANTHPATLRLLGFGLDATSGPMVVTGVMPNGTVGAALKKQLAGEPPPAWDASQRSICICGICAALAHLHSQGIIHRDLKPENVFLDSRWKPVVADFGISRYTQLGVEQTVGIGTPLFMAPDLYGEDDYGVLADIFSFAVVLYNFFAEPGTLDDGHGRFRSPQNLMMRIMKGARYVRPANVPDAHWSLICAAWDASPEKRPTFREMIDDFAVHHKYVFAGADIAKVIEYENRIMAAATPEAEADREAKALLAMARRASEPGDPLAGLPTVGRSGGIAVPGLSLSASRSGGGAKKKASFRWD
jgi:serine/threonine protein kinase